MHISLKKPFGTLLALLLPSMVLMPQNLLFLQAQESQVETGAGTNSLNTGQEGEGNSSSSDSENTSDSTDSSNPTNPSNPSNPSDSDPEEEKPEDSNPNPDDSDGSGSDQDEGSGKPDQPEQDDSGTESNPTTVQFSDRYLSSTTTLDEQGNPYLIVIKVEQALPDNDRQHPYRINLGINPDNEQKIALSGNARLSAQESATVMLSFGPVIESAYLALPVRSASMSDGTVAMLENNQTGRYSPVADSYLIKAENEDELSYIMMPFSEIEVKNATIQVVNNAKIFSDLSSLPEWGQGPVNYVSSRNIMMGTGNGETFSADETVTRAQFATTIYRFSDQSTPKSWPESVPHGFWWSTAAGYVVDKKIMGVGSSFDPDTEISREQAATIFYRASGDTLENSSVLDTYKDKFKVSEWALDGMAWAVEHGILGQGSNLDPGNSLNRLELAALIERYLQQGYN